MDGPAPRKEWVERALRERVGLGAAFLVGRNRGCHPVRAHDLAEEAVQYALSQAARIADLAGRFESFEHFCNWVRKVAINHVRSVFRRELVQLPMQIWEAIVGPAAGPPANTAAVRELLEQLPEDERRLLLLPYEEGLTLDQIAERFLPPDDRTENARRLDVWRRRREILRRVRQKLLASGFIPTGQGIMFEDAAEKALRGTSA